MTLERAFLHALAAVPAAAQTIPDAGFTDPWGIVQTGGVVGVLLFNVWSLMTGKLVPEKRLDKAEREAEFWRDMWLRTYGTAERTTQVVEKVVSPDTARLDRLAVLEDKFRTLESRAHPTPRRGKK